MSILSNQRFIEKVALEGRGGPTSANMLRFIRQVIRENAFSDKVMPAQSISPAACTRSANHEGFSKIVDIEPRSRAVILPIRGTSDSQYVRANRMEIPFFKIASKVFEKEISELRTYEMPITQIIEDNTVRDMHEQKDLYFMNLSYKATSGTGQILTKTGFLDRPALRDLFQTIDRGRLASAVVLMSKVKYNELVGNPAIETFGSQLAGDTFVNGYRYGVIMGKSVIVTTKNDQLTRNPFAPSTFELSADGSSSVLAFDRDTSASQIVPYDPAYLIGVNLKNLHVGNVLTNQLYPTGGAGVNNLINGGFVAATSAAITDNAATVSGGAFAAGTDGDGAGNTFAAVSTDPTTKNWLGNTVMVYTRDNYLGRNYVLADVSFYIDQRFSKLTWYSEMEIGMAFGNSNAVGQLTFQ